MSDKYVLKKLNVERVVLDKVVADKLAREGWKILSAPAPAAAPAAPETPVTPPVAPENTADAEKPTDKNTVTEIRDYAAAHAIALGTANTKAEMLAVINGAD